MIASALALLLGLLAAGCNGELVSGGGAPAKMDVVSGDLQTATVGTELPNDLVVEVTDDKGRPVRGQIVNFRVIAGGGSVFAGAALTDDNGQARERWTLGTVAGDTQRVEARAVDPATGAALVFATFRAVGTPDAPVAVSAAGATSFTGLPSLPLADSVAVFVRDVYGNPVPGQTVAWSVLQGGGSTSPASSVTGPNGVARTRWTLGPQFAEVQVLQAAAGVALTTQFTANGQLPPGAVLVKVSGDAQTGTVGQALGAPLVVRVQHADGRPIAGIPVTFTLPAGYGGVTPATAVSDADGRVSAQWTLRTFPGGLQVSASIPTGSMVTFTATAQVGPAAALQKVSGDGQQGRAGAVLADSLEVRAVDTYGNGVAGVTVTWSAASGAVSPATATTRADGTARTAYTLPSAAGAASAQASAPGVQPVAFSATALSVPVSMGIAQPTPNSVRSGALRVVVVVDSANASVASVVASAAGRSVTLQPGSGPGTVAGTLSLVGAPMGPTELRVVATTVNGDSSVVSTTFIHDAPPSLSVLAPLRNTVARPDLRLDVDCTDDDPAGCASVTVTAYTSSAGLVPLASGTSSVHTTVSLAAYEGQVLTINIEGRDSRGQRVLGGDTVFVEGSAALTAVASAGAHLLDADAGRVLYADTAGSVWLRAGSTETLLAAGVEPRIGRLHPQGAIFGGGRVWDWRGGSLSDLGPLNSSLSLRVRGTWAIWSNATALYRRDLAAGTTVQVSSDAINIDNDVAGGVVVFGTGPSASGDGYDLYRFDGAGTTRLTTHADASYWALFPVTDGTNVVFAKRATNPALTGGIALWRDGTETLLTSSGGRMDPRRNYDANNGWIAWTSTDAGGILQVHTRAPDGTDRRVTSTGTPSEMRALGPDGTVVYTNGGWMYAIRAPYTGAATRIAHDWFLFRAPRFQDGDLLFFLGRTVFRVNY